MLAFIPHMLSEEWGIAFYGKIYLVKVIKDEQRSDAVKGGQQTCQHGLQRLVRTLLNQQRKK